MMIRIEIATAVETLWKSASIAAGGKVFSRETKKRSAGMPLKNDCIGLALKRRDNAFDLSMKCLSIDAMY